MISHSQRSNRWTSDDKVESLKPIGRWTDFSCSNSCIIWQQSIQECNHGFLTRKRIGCCSLSDRLSRWKPCSFLTNFPHRFSHMRPSKGAGEFLRGSQGKTFTWEPIPHPNYTQTVCSICITRFFKKATYALFSVKLMHCFLIMVNHVVYPQDFYWAFCLQHLVSLMSLRIKYTYTSHP